MQEEGTLTSTPGSPGSPASPGFPGFPEVPLGPWVERKDRVMQQAPGSRL